MKPPHPVTLISDLPSHCGETVALRGWLYGKRSGGKVLFLQMRDGTGVCQCVVEAVTMEAFQAAKDLTHESSFSMTGEVRADERSPGGIEVSVRSLSVIQIADEYPISRKSHGVDFLMSHRHLWLRSERPGRILQVRHTLIKACRDFFDGNGFTLIDTPILSPSAGEDAQSVFSVDYFGDTVFLTQTGQLYLESACMAFGKVYCFGPTFRAEKSKTRRHLTEFWMLEPEVAFADLDEIVLLAEDLICTVVQAVLDKHEEDLECLGRDVAPLKKISKPFARITYSEAVARLRSNETRQFLEDELASDKKRLRQWIAELGELEEKLGCARKGWQKDKLQGEIAELKEHMQELERDIATRPGHIASAQNFTWGGDLGGSDETILSRQFEKPVFVINYPKQAKAFYMKVSDEDDRVVRNMDLLAPEGYGEIIGGSQREHDAAVLMSRLAEEGLDAENYRWYVDLRRYGSVPHGGFGLGIERTLSWICGLKHVRESIPFPRTMGRIYP